MIDMFIVRERERESRYREIQLLQQLLIVRDINYTEVTSSICTQSVSGNI